MKNVFLLCTLLFCMLFSQAQERENKQLPKIQATNLGQITSAKGWMIQKDGQWISRSNRIPICIENEYKSLIDYEETGRGFTNFVSYQFKEIKIDTTTYVILLYKSKTGLYKYPDIERGWIPYTSVYYYILSKNEFNKIKDFDFVDGEVNTVKLDYLYWGGVDKITGETINLDIEKSINEHLNTDKKKDKIQQLIFKIGLYKSKNIVQFHIYGLSEQYYPLDFYNDSPDYFPAKLSFSCISTYDYFDKKDYPCLATILETNEIFKYCYYETSYANFNMFIKLP